MPLPPVAPPRNRRPPPLAPTPPQAKQQLAQLMWLRQSEDIVLEALARLAALGDDMLRLLRQ